MKIPEPRKLPSGNWFIQLRIDGQSISITEADKDTCIAKAMAYKTGVIKAKKNPAPITLTAAIDKYIDLRRSALSPSTIRGYRTIQKSRFQSIMNLPLATLNKNKLQSAINSESKKYKAKTLQNSWRFIASVIKEETGDIYNLSLPQVIPNERPFLAPDQIQAFLTAIRDTDIEIPALLGLWSLRLSEILGLKWSSVDLNNRTIRIENTMVPNEYHKLEQKQTTKNISSRRVIPIVDRLAELMEMQPKTSEYVCSKSRNTLRKKINAICKQNNLPEIGVHGLRHSFASLAYYLNVPEKVAMRIGGWTNDATMRKIYTHISNTQFNNETSKMLDFFNIQKQDC